MNFFTLVRSGKVHSLVQLAHNAFFMSVSPYDLKSVFRHPNKYELIFLGAERWNFPWRSMINL